ncbi:MAG: hypothetical protein M1830_006972, partial [Pleopsidium flavum]
GIPVLQNLQLPHVVNQGYVNLRCGWTLGCPAEIRPINYGNGGPIAEKYYRDGFQELFPNSTVPEVIGVGCCAQFAVTKEKLLERPMDDYEHYRQWLLGTSLDDDISGRIMEYSWHSKSLVRSEQVQAWVEEALPAAGANSVRLLVERR